MALRGLGVYLLLEPVEPSHRSYNDGASNLLASHHRGLTGLGGLFGIWGSILAARSWLFPSPYATPLDQGCGLATVRARRPS
jgi:hypothetical protein